MIDNRLLTLEAIEQLAKTSLLNAGFSEAQATAIAENVTLAERDGCVSHGLFRIPFYVKALVNATANPKAIPELNVGDSSVVHVNANGGFCPLALKTGEQALMDKARQQGIAALAIHNTYNIAALWPEVERLAEAGFVVFAFTASTACVAPAGGTDPIYGTNPMAFGFPRKDHPPLVFDQASSACARGEIQLHLRDGKPLPEGWALDKNGQPTTDPEAALQGAQLTFGGYKGASIALMVELLAGALVGDLFSIESSRQDTHSVGAPLGGEFIMAIDPSHCAGPTSYLDRAETLFAEVLKQPGTRLPSARRYAKRQQHMTEGVNVSAILLNELEALIAAK